MRGIGFNFQHIFKVERTMLIIGEWIIKITGSDRQHMGHNSDITD